MISADVALEEILQTNKAMLAALQKMSGGPGGGSASAKELDKTNKGLSAGMVATKTAAFGAGLAFSAATKAIGLLGKGVSTLAGGAVDAANAMKALAAAATNGDAGFSAISSAMSALPGPFKIVGELAGIYGAVLEKNIKTHEALSKSGATFGGDLDRMRSSANRMYLGLDQFAAVVGKNSEIFSTMGGNVQDGVNKFVKIQTTMMAPGSPIANNLATLGYSMEEAANLTASYMKSQGSMNKSGLNDTAKVAKGVQEYAQELSVLTQLTGKNREELQKELDKQNAEAQWAAFLAQQSPEKAKKLQQSMQAAMMQGGQGAADALKATAMGFPPLTEAGKLYAATQTAGMKSVEEMNKRANDSSISSEQNRKLQRAATAKYIAEQSKDQKKFQDVLRADAAAGGKLSESFATATQLQTKFMKDGKMMSEEEIAAKLEQMENESKQSESGAAAAKNQQKAVMDLTNSMLNQLMPIFAKMFDVSMVVLKYLAELVPKALQFVTGFYSEVLKPAFKELFGDISLDDLLNPLRDFMKGLFGTDSVDFKSIKENLVGFLQPIVGLGESLLQGIDFEQLGADFRKVFGSIGNFITSVSTALTGAFGEEGGIGGFLQKIFHDFMHGLSGIVDIITIIVVKVIESPLFETLKKMFLKFSNLISNIVDTVMQLVNSPVGTFLMDRIINVFNFFGEIINDIIDAVDGVVDIISGLLSFITGDFSGGWEKIKSGIGKIIGAIVDALLAYPRYILRQIAAGWELVKESVMGIWKSLKEAFGILKDKLKELWDGGWPAIWQAIKDMINGMIDSIKAIGKKIWSSITSIFGGDDKDAAAKKAAEDKKKADEAAAAAAKQKADEEAKKKASTTTATKKMTPAEEAAAKKAAAAEEAAKKNATKISTAYIDVANIGKMNTEKRAAGGPVIPGQPYTVGEQGQELFVPKQAGQILSNPAFKSAMGAVTAKQSGLGKSNHVTDALSGIGKNIHEAVASVAKTTSSHGLTAEQGKNLIAELQTLNKQTEVLRKIALDTAEHTRKTVAATKSLNGNLFA